MPLSAPQSQPHRPTLQREASLDVKARLAARKRGQTVSTAHYILAIMADGGPAAQRLRTAGVREASLLRVLPYLEPEAPACIERAWERALRAGASDLSVSLMEAMLADRLSHARMTLEQAGADLSALGVVPPVRSPRPPLRKRVAPVTSDPGAGDPGAGDPGTSARGARSTSDSLTRTTGHGVVPPRRRAPRPPRPPRRIQPNRYRVVDDGLPSVFALPETVCPMLNKIGRNLCQAVLDGSLEPATVEPALLHRTLDILARKQGRHPLIVGPPGVGKTTLVHALARHMVERVRGLGDRAPDEAPTIVEVPAAALTAGTGVRGALADRIMRLLAEAEAAEGRVVLFVDEFHALISAAEGSDEALAELKTALCKPHIALIGASTGPELQPVADRDPAMMRRFTLIEMHEPGRDEALAAISRGIDSYAVHHGLRYAPAALEAAVDMSMRYVRERHLPEKAFAILDMAGARASRRRVGEVGVQAVAEIVGEMCAVPVERLMQTDASRFSAIETHLQTKLVGQAQVWPRIGDALRRASRRRERQGPLATLLFLGPSGVGKTECAKALSEHLLGPGAMTRIDMSELSESHSVSRLFGAPPGYIGHGRGGVLTEALRRRPYQLVLLDEIEKAHTDVWMSLLSLFDEGRITDATGRVIDAKDTIIVMTSNLGAAKPRSAVGFGHQSEPSFDAEACLKSLKRSLPPELLNRFDDTLVFGHLKHQDYLTWARRRFDAYAEHLRQTHGLRVRVAAGAAERLVDADGWDRELGIRALRRHFARVIETPVAEALEKSPRAIVLGSASPSSATPSGASPR